MPDTAAIGALDPDSPFKYVGGDAALDLVNTVDWTSTGTRRDRLITYDRLADWAEGAGIVPPDVAVCLRRAARGDPDRGRKAVRAARRTREVLRNAFQDSALGECAGPELHALNGLLSETLPRLRLEASGPRVVFSWDEWGEDPSCLLWPVIFSAATLLTSEEASRIGMCPGDDCGWMFVDRSRNGLRRWCEMATCGTTAKNRRRRAGPRP
jgi:predicted RNA-binding Zn ribbon-like protein